jgi:hydrogen peroxide-dependent heme synthase
VPEETSIEVPQTLEGWYVLHDAYRLDWPKWLALSPAKREVIVIETVAWITTAANTLKGDSALYSLLTQKGDLMFLHYRETPDAINAVELSLRQLAIFEYLIPAYSYLSVIEIGLYELTAMARKKLSDQGITPGSEQYSEFFEPEMAKQQQRVHSRLFQKIPEQRYICFYPMNKRRGEQVNWYTLSMEQRRDMMRGHGRIGHMFHKEVTQIIGGSIGLDDWEWGVSLHADDALVFKKLIHEMRFDPASALYAEFGPFYVGIRCTPEQLPALLAGRLE